MCRVNVGCGMTPTAGWLNCDNSLSARLARIPDRLLGLAAGLGLLTPQQLAYIRFCRSHQIRYCNAATHLPCATNSAAVLYSSHMLEHLDQAEARAFVQEAYRILVPGGIIRIVVPGLARKVADYCEHGDADQFIRSLWLATPKPRTLIEQLRTALIGPRHHAWMYDEKSLCALLQDCGFRNPLALAPGVTTIVAPAPLNLIEGMEESIYVEAEKLRPQAATSASRDLPGLMTRARGPDISPTILIDTHVRRQINRDRNEPKRPGWLASQTLKRQATQ